jgi:hypothetical protein
LHFFPIQTILLLLRKNEFMMAQMMIEKQVNFYFEDFNYTRYFLDVKDKFR